MGGAGSICKLGGVQAEFYVGGAVIVDHDVIGSVCKIRQRFHDIDHKNAHFIAFLLKAVFVEIQNAAALVAVVQFS